MRLVIDSNRFLAGLLKDSTSREILFCNRLEFCSPDHMIVEIDKYRQYIQGKTGLTSEKLDVLICCLLDRVEMIPYEDFKSEFAKAQDIMRTIDIKDSPFLAAGIALGANGIWTEDKHFQKQNILKVYSTKDLVELLKEK